MINLLKNKVCVILGGSGFIGSHLCDALIKEEPKRLVIFDNLSASSLDNINHLLKDERIEFVNGDVRDYEMVEKYVLQSEMVFNLAASNVGHSTIYPRINLETNIIGTFNILQAIRKKLDIRLIHVSSGSVSTSSTPYAISKLAGELYVKFSLFYGIKATVIRPYHVFGERQDIKGTCGVVNIFLSRVMFGLSPIIWGTGMSKKNFTYVKDLVDAILLVVNNDDTVGKIYDVASDTKITIKDLAHLLIERYADDKRLKPVYDRPKLGENMELFPDTTKIRELGWKTKFTFKEGLDITKKWVEEQL